MHFWIVYIYLYTRLHIQLGVLRIIFNKRVENNVLKISQNIVAIINNII